ncbi:hypothetical protein A176_007125 [Myxococcus hansupus]|uniref:Uncharacterized protein n=1 Tax=Pseudomyxococcus hansupus TaxID=1297742 RepID=A0A0H4X8C2_9BACT|nr:ABC-three component system protein [Myxococcus hansupus]AKQ70213.1 hypothetical protein A176_007125 [Myxococcus hansupus]
MIHRLFSDLPTFKSLHLHSGLNVLLADKSPGATDRQTRNGAGKTSFVDLIHFLLGARSAPRSTFRLDPLKDSSFGMEFDLRGHNIVVRRSGADSARIQLEGVPPSWGVPEEVSNEAWKALLGPAMFGLPPADSGKAAPSFRELMAYFARRQLDGGFTAPTKSSSVQQTGSQQTAVTYLLGLDWSIPQEWQRVREQEASLKELKKASGEGPLSPILGSAATLRTQLALAEERARKLRGAIASFQVHAQYHELEKEASRLTRDLNGLVDDNALDRQRAEELRAAVVAEAPPTPPDLERLYEEIGVHLSSAVLRRFEELQAFHDSVVRNRSSYLKSELAALEHRVEERDRKKGELDQRRSEVMEILRSHGALEHFSKLQTELSRVEAEAETLRLRYSAAEALESSRVTMALERTRLLTRLGEDYREQENVLGRAIVAFEEISRSLYEDAGSLTIKATPNGPSFEIQIHGARSKGIQNMQIFCFDMMLMRLCTERGRGPGFLVHDSHLFDGVDERQVAKALQLGARLSDELGFQYIVTMNSDAVPRDLPPGFSLDRHVLPIRLTDATEDGGLFGIRFA